jgi:hypothetical protein
MAATVYGDINFGLSVETGIYAGAVDFDASIQEKWIPGTAGAEVAGATYGPTATWSMSGFLDTGATLSAVTGAALILANVVDWTDLIGHGYTTGGTSIVTSHKAALKSDDAEARDIGGVFKPFIV